MFEHQAVADWGSLTYPQPMRWKLTLVTMMATLLLATAAYALKPCPRSCNDARQPAGSCLKRATWVGVGRIENVKKRTMKAMGATFTFADFDFVVERFEKGAHAFRRVPSHTVHCYNSGAILKNPKGKWRMFARYPIDPAARASYLHIERVTAANAPLPSATAAPPPTGPAPTTATPVTQPAAPSAQPSHAAAQPTTAQPTAPSAPPTAPPPAACLYAPKHSTPSTADCWLFGLAIACWLSSARRVARPVSFLRAGRR